MENLFNKVDMNRFQAKQQEKHLPRNHREALIEDIRAKINKERIGTKYKPMSYMGVNLKVKHLSDFDVAWHLAECLKASSFSRCFFGRLKAEERAANE